MDRESAADPEGLGGLKQDKLKNFESTQASGVDCLFSLQLYDRRGIRASCRCIQGMLL